MDGRLVEQQDRRRLRDGQREEDELALAERELARVATDADARGRRDRWRPRPRRGRRAARPRIGSSCGSRPRATTSSTRIANGSADSCGHDREPAGDAERGRAPRAATPSSSTRPAVASSEPGERAQQRRLAGAVRADEGDALAGRRSGGRRRAARSRAPIGDGRRSAAERRIGVIGSLTARSPRGRGAAGTRKNGAPMIAVTTPTGISPSIRAPRSATTSRLAPNSGRRAAARRARSGPTSEPDDVRHDEPDEPDQARDRDRGRRHERREAQEDRALPADVDAEVGRRLLAEQEPVERRGPERG